MSALLTGSAASPVTFAWAGLGAMFLTILLALGLRDPVFADVDRSSADGSESPDGADVDRGQAAIPDKGRPAGSAGSANPGGTASGAGSGVIGAIQAERATVDAFRLKLRKNDLKGALADLAAIVEKDPLAAKEPELREAIIDLSQRVTMLPGDEPDRMFALMAQKMGTLGIDMLYQIVTTKGGSRAAKFAERLMLDPAVLARGGPGVRIAWDIRRSKGCDEKKTLFERAGTDGDGRTIGQLHLLNKDCGRRRSDTTCCLYKDPGLVAAIDALKARGFQ